MSRFTKVVALGALTVGVLVFSSTSAMAENRQGAQPPQSGVTFAAHAQQSSPAGNRQGV